VNQGGLRLVLCEIENHSCKCCMVTRCHLPDRFDFLSSGVFERMRDKRKRHFRCAILFPQNFPQPFSDTWDFGNCEYSRRGSLDRYSIYTAFYKNIHIHCIR
jgi:hypothetical protein